MTAAAVAFDGMGVLYRHGDDLGGLLEPYARAHGCVASSAEIEAAYVECSLGRTTSAELWRALAVSAAVDREYCALEQVTAGMPQLLSELTAAGVRTACLSNDVAEWAALRRTSTGLDAWIDTWVISGEVGARKPDPAIYLALLDRLGLPAEQVRLVDDRPANLAAAARLGIAPVGFGRSGGGPWPTATTTAELAVVLRQWHQVRG